MFKVKYKGDIKTKDNIFTVYSVSDDYFLIYINSRWKWIDMGATEPYIKVVGMQYNGYNYLLYF